tara:strand:+ start:1390 stop:2466 length:1077 start_codon:yes stop_codon:yes gene_type:complete
MTKVYVRFLISGYLKSFLNITLVFFCLVFILNLLTEVEFFKDINVSSLFILYVSFINSPSLVFEMFPFIFLISTQVFFINLFKDQQIQIFKYSGLKNSIILKILVLTSFFMGLIIITLFYNLSSNLKNIYLELKNTYTSDNKYLAVITNNGLWIKDNLNNKINIINASKIENTFLLDASITEFDENFTVLRHIQSKKIDISNNNWLIINPIVHKGNEKNNFNSINFYSNFDYERIQSLFSNLSSLSLLELFNLRKNYQLLNLSTTEVNIQLYKLFTWPIYLALMTILASIIMFNTKEFKSNTLKISIGLFFSVLIYYINNFFNVMGGTEKINVSVSVFLPIIILMIINLFYNRNINEK